MIRLPYLFLFFLLLSACSHNPTVKKATLKDIDIIGEKQQKTSVFIKPKSDDDIRRAYAEYLSYASKNENARLVAINRLAELEFEMVSKLKEEQEANTKNIDDLDDSFYNARIDKTIELLKTSIRDYPNARGNDKVLYQLAKAYDQKGDLENSARTLQILIKKYPKSAFYIESQFRLGEIAFSSRKYMNAEDTYTDIIGSKKNNVFYEKALFKRGWARFKQEYYLEAVDDYLEAVLQHNFDEYSELNKTEKEHFKEYFRAIGLAFSYLGGAEPLNEYFKENNSFPYIYYTYAHVSEIYLKQERYSDAVETLKYFNKYHPNSKNIPDSQIKIIEIWKNSGFTKQAYNAIDNFYTNFNPQSQYWMSKNADEKIYKVASSSLKDNVLIVSAHFHSKFQKKHKSSDFKQANKWYQRYLKHFSSNARKDNVYFLYAQLLDENKKYIDALKYYELAAYDSDIILNKKAAYATITVSNKLYMSKAPAKDKNIWLNKHIDYALLYGQLYPSEKKTESIIVHAAELAFTSKQYTKAIEIADTVPDGAKYKNKFNAYLIKANSHVKLSQYAEAESNYQSILQLESLHPKNRKQIEDKLAVAIYQQASSAQSPQDALNHYTRISRQAPSSDIAATGLYDAIALSMKNQQWNQSIHYIKQFQSLYPNHKLNRDVTKKLSVAYLSSNQGLKAAQEFEKISSFGESNDVKIAALWQAAELYENKNDTKSAIRSYEELAKKHVKPYPQNMEAMNKLTILYSDNHNPNQTRYWRGKILSADRKIPKGEKTDRTKLIASSASLELAKNTHKVFDSYELVLPLKTSLKKKKTAMQKAVLLYGKASKYGLSETSTEATHSIAEIYNSFSKALITSERPRNLSKDELEQYEILLEDRAFPFEEKAIEFFETNLSHIKDGVYDDWVKQSHAKLKELFPTRYNRDAKADDYINVLH